MNEAAAEKEMAIALPNGGEIILQRIPAGSFAMGERGVFPEEEPVHVVSIPEDYYLGRFPVTQRQFAAWTESEHYQKWFERHRDQIRDTSPEKVAELHDNYFSGKPDHPAEQVTWWEAHGFADWLNETGQIPKGSKAALPTEAQWEHACRAGTRSKYWKGDSEADLADIGWFGGNAGSETHQVGEKDAPNPWGLHDLHGNVAEWCQDYLDPFRYRKLVEGAVDDPLLAVTEVENSPADPDFVALVEILGRFGKGDLPFMPGDGGPLRRLQAIAENVVANGNEQWRTVLDASAAALKADEWPAEAEQLATAVLPVFQNLVDQASGAIPARVLRGGSWDNSAASCRSAFRDRSAPGSRFGNMGFRLAVVPVRSGQEQDREKQEPETSAQRNAALEPACDSGRVEATAWSGDEPQPEPPPSPPTPKQPRSGPDFFKIFRIFTKRDS